MDLEERIKSLTDYSFLDKADQENYEFFLTCVRLGRISLAIKCPKFITREFLEEYGDNVIEIAKKDFPYSLRDSRAFRDFLLEKKEYDLLINLKYKIIMEIQDPAVFAILDRIADADIKSGHVYREYSQYRAMKLKRFDVFTDGSFPNDREFVDMYYDDIITFIDQVKYPGHYVFIKSMEVGNFELAEKQLYNSYLEDELLEAVVKKYWDKVVAFNDPRVSVLFVRSKTLFDYYLQNKRFDLIIQFAPFLVTKEIVDQHEEEIMNSFGTRVANYSASNSALFDLCLKNKRYDLCAQFNVDWTEELVQAHGRDILPYFKVLPYALNKNASLFNLVIESQRFDLVNYFDKSLITDEILEKYGVQIVQHMDRISYDFLGNPLVLKCVLICKKYDSVERFYEEAFTDEIISSPEFLEFLKVTDKIPYGLYKANVLEAVLKIERYDLVERFLYYTELFTDEMIEKYGLILLDKIDHIPSGLCSNTKLLEIVIRANRYDLIENFYESAFTDELLKKLISIIPANADKVPYYLNNEKGIRMILSQQRYDLISADNIYYNVFTEDVCRDFAEVLLTKVPFLNVFSRSNVLLRYALDNQMAELIPKFSIRAFDDELIEKYGETLYPLLVEKFKNEEVFTLGIKNAHLFGFSRHEGHIELRSLLLLFLRKGMTENLYKFNPEYFTDELLEEYYELLLPTLKDGRGYLGESKYLFDRVLQEGRFEYFKYFRDSIITDEILDKYADQLLNYFTSEGTISGNLQRNSHFFEIVILNNREDLFEQFNTGAFSKDIVDKYFDVIVNYIRKNNNEIPWGFQSLELFDKFVKEGLTDLALKMDGVYFNADYIKSNYGTLLNLARMDYDSNFSKRMFSDMNFVEIFISQCSVEDIQYINKSLFLRKLDEYYPKLIQWVIEYNDSKIPVELVSFDKLKKYCKEKGYDELYLNFTMGSSNDLGMSKDTDLDTVIDEYAPLLGMSKEDLKSRLKFLYSTNDEILRTILPKMLEDRYRIINPKHLLTICLYPDLQYEIINLNDHELLIIDRILDVTDNVEYDSTSILYNVLKNLKYYKKIINEAERINDEQLLNLIYILQRKHNVFNINSVEDLSNQRLLEKMLYKFSQFDINIATKNDINNVKDMLLLKKYGIDLIEASFICERYCRDKEIVINSDLDEYLKNILVDIYDIIHCENIDELKFKYSSSDLVIPDFNSMLYLEAYIREEYSKLYDKTLYKTKDEDKLENNEHLIDNPEALERMKAISYNGKKPQVYLLRDDFNLQIHALGAYSGYTRPESFLDDWNRPKMASHGICTSYIGNNQIANARAYHPILGFDTMGGSDLLLSANYDIGSSMANESYATSREIVANFLPPDENINYTRHTHNEMVLERMRYVGIVACKRMPSYIVYLLDDVNNKYNFMTKNELIEEFKNSGKDEVIKEIQDNKSTHFVDRLLKDNKISQEDAKKIQCVYYYEEVAQAAVDMGLPIVIVDRLYYAKREQRKCDLIYEQLLQTKDPSYISLLLVTYFNNMIGCVDYTNSGAEYCKCFNDDGFDELFNKLLNDINSIEDSEIRLRHLVVLGSEIDKEKSKREDFRGGAPRQLKSLKSYQDIINKRIEEIKLSMTEGYNGKNI